MKKSTQGRNNSNFNPKNDTFYKEIRQNITNDRILFVYRENGKVINSCPYSHSNGGRVVSSQERWGGIRAWLISKDDPYDEGPKNGHGVGMS